jgi:transcriptional regulator with XRE-family HTH domain
VETIVTLGELIKKKRTKKKWSQQDLAEKTNLAMSTISKIEQDMIASPDLYTAHALANVLDISMDDMADIIVSNQKEEK